MEDSKRMIEFQTPHVQKGQINPHGHSGFNAIHPGRRAACSTESVQPSYFPSVDLGIEKVQPEKCYRIKIGSKKIINKTIELP